MRAGICGLSLMTLALFGGWALPSQAATFVAAKHLIMVKPGVDKIYGTYVFAVTNSGAEPEVYNVPVNMPKEMEQFVVEEGATQDDVQAGAEGGLTIEKAFDPGTNLISIRFVAKADGADSKLTLVPKVPIEHLTVLADKQRLEVTAPGLKPSTSAIGGDDLNSFVIEGGVSAGDTLEIAIAGIPSGRGGLWILGWIFAMVLVIAVIVLTMLTMPRGDHNDQSELVVGEG